MNVEATTPLNLGRRLWDGTPTADRPIVPPHMLHGGLLRNGERRYRSLAILRHRLQRGLSVTHATGTRCWKGHVKE